MRLGGFPAIHIAEYTEESAYKIVYDIYSSIILRDTVQRYHIRDVELLERVVRYVFDNIFSLNLKEEIMQSMQASPILGKSIIITPKS